MMVLHAENLRTGFPSKKTAKILAHDIDFSLPEGKLIALMGANGSGKSTLLRTLAGLQQPLNGTIYYQNVPLDTLSFRALAKARALVLNEPLRLGYITAGDFVRMGRFPYLNFLKKGQGLNRGVITEALEMTSTKPLMERWFHELSDGEKQRVLIARALVQNTRLLLMDEPTSHLDVIGRVELMSLLKTHGRANGENNFLFNP